MMGMFELEERKCHSICSRMILDNEVPLAWDSSSRILIVKHEDSHSKFQRMTATLADKCNFHLDNYERMVDYKTGNYKPDQNKGTVQGQGGMRDVYSDEAKYFNRSKYANMPGRNNGPVVTGGKKG